jgi:hypothetical protein
LVVASNKDANTVFVSQAITITKATVNKNIKPLKGNNPKKEATAAIPTNPIR